MPRRKRAEASQEQLTRLADAVLAEIEAAGLTDEKIRANGGPSNSTMTKTREARYPTPDDKTLDKLDAGLRWAEGSARGVLWRGEEPVRIAERSQERSASSFTISGQDRDRLVELLRSVGQSMNEAVKILGS